MIEVFIYTIVGFPPAYDNKNTRRVFAETQTGYSLLGLRPTGKLVLQFLKKKKTKNQSPFNPQ